MLDTREIICPEISEFGEPCTERGTHAIHMTDPDDHGLITSWGQPALLHPVFVRCEAGCGMAIIRDGNDPHSVFEIRHNPDDSHTFIQDDGREQTVKVVVRPPRPLRAV